MRAAREEVCDIMSFQFPDDRRGYGEAPTEAMDPPPRAEAQRYEAPRYERPVERAVDPPPVGPREPRSWTVGRVGQFIYILLGVLDALLIIRFALKLLAANPDAGFSSFIYGVTQSFVEPFQGVFPSPATHASVLEVATLLAIIVYALVAWLVVNLVELIVSRWPGRAY